MRRALAFLTPLGFLAPRGAAATPTATTLTWFPVVGALLGLALGAIWWGADRWWPALVAAAIVVVADLALTGLLHLDGLADSADGLLPHLDRPRRLAVMAAPDVGAFGVAVVGAALLTRFAALATATPVPLALAGVWCGSRTAMAVVARRLPYARGEGLASAFLGGSAAAVGGVGLVLAMALGAVGARGQGVVAVIACLAGAAAVAALAQRRIGGFTGDVLGAAGVVGETVGLVVLAARW